MGSPLSPPDGDPPPALDLAGVTSDLRPLLLWLANAVELLNLAQGHVLAMERELDIEGGTGMDWEGSWGRSGVKLGNFWGDSHGI